MFRVFLIVFVVGVLAAAGGLVAIGMFPADPPVKSIEKTVPNDKFQGR